MTLRRMTVEDLERMARKESPLYLTEMEIVLLGHLASGARQGECAHLMGKTKFRINDLSSVAFFKMNAPNASNAVAECIYYGVLIRTSDGAWVPNPAWNRLPPRNKRVLREEPGPGKA